MPKHPLLKPWHVTTSYHNQHLVLNQHNVMLNEQ
jgi:hypothetical protein